MKTEVPIALSNRHVHLTEEHIALLFGEGYELTWIKDLSQPHQFACDEKVDIQGPKGVLKGVRILGPARKADQVEILASDAFKLGVPVVIRDSGQIDGTPGCTIIGPKGSVEINQGVIVASRHIHMSLEEAAEYGVKNDDIVNIEVPGPRGLVFNHVLVRASENYALDFHVDTEEGNAAGAKNGMICKLIK